jgi:N-acetylmuramoyl-L-alanine amidase
MAPNPDWIALEPFQNTLTKTDFLRLLQTVYAPENAWLPYIELGDHEARVRKTLEPESFWNLKLRSADQPSPSRAPLFWRPLTSLGSYPLGRPLTGYRIAIDPGHLGGMYAKMEARWFQIGHTKPVTEGDLTLQVARILGPILSALGAEICMVRSEEGPNTPLRPEDLRDPDAPAKGELLFYRIGEIRQRAHLVNRQFQPDLVVCLHFNAEDWGDPHQPTLTPNNHLHTLVNGCYSTAELRMDDLRFEMLWRLLSGVIHEEIPVSESVSAALAAATGLPPFEYKGTNARKVGDGTHVWARNLLANRLYQCPVLFLEPYVMNSREVWERVQAGPYPGLKKIAGKIRPNLFQEYAEAVAEGLKTHAERVRAGR